MREEDMSASCRRLKTVIASSVTATLNGLSKVHVYIWIAWLVLFQMLLTGCANVRLQDLGEVDKISRTGKSIILLRIAEETSCRGRSNDVQLHGLFGSNKGFRVFLGVPPFYADELLTYEASSGSHFSPSMAASHKSWLAIPVGPGRHLLTIFPPQCNSPDCGAMRGVVAGKKPQIIYVGSYLAGGFSDGSSCFPGIRVVDETPDAREVANRDLSYLTLAVQLPKALPEICKGDSQGYKSVCRLEPLPEKIGFARYTRPLSSIRYSDWLQRTRMENFSQTMDEGLSAAGEIPGVGIALVILSIPAGLIDSIRSGSLREKWSPCLTRLQ